MGIDLILLPLNPLGDPLTKHFSSWSILDLRRRQALWDEIRALPFQMLSAPLSTPLGVWEAGDDTTAKDAASAQGIWDIRKITSDGYDTPLCHVSCADLLSLREHEGVQDNPENRAAWAYLAELPGDARIILYWC